MSRTARQPTAASDPGTSTTVSDSLRPIKPADFGYDQARHLLWRAGFGGTPMQIRALASWGPERAVDHLLSLDAGTYPEPRADDFNQSIMTPPSAEERRRYREALRRGDEDVVAQFRRTRQAQQREDRAQVADMQRWWLKRMIETPRPLEEKMTLFWHGHFATSYRTIENSYHQFMQNQLFRRHAVGNFGTLLGAIIRDPAMIKYLNNDQNRRQSPNENLARELMELFSLGEGNYTERDIREGARALTGYTFEGNEFVFLQQAHDTGSKQILGKRGNLDGEGFVAAILDQRACSQFIAKKLYEFFAAEVPASKTDPLHGPSRQVVLRLASTLQRNRYELRPMLRELLLSEHFYEPRLMGEQIKSPVELIIGAVRSLLTPVRDLGILNDALDLMGQRLFFPPNVAGWAGGRTWINTSTLFVRQNILNFLLTGRTPSGYDPLARDEPYDPEPLLADLSESDPGAERDPQRVAPYLLRFALGGEPDPSRLRTLLDFAQGHGDRVSAPIVTGMLALITAMPEYQLA